MKRKGEEFKVKIDLEPKSDKTLTITVPYEWKEILQKMSDKMGRTLSEILRAYLRPLVEKYKYLRKGENKVEKKGVQKK